MADAFLGEIRLFSGGFAPEGWRICNGDLLPISENPMLFALLGGKYGGDGVSSFGLPDLRGRVPIGAGSGLGLTPRPLSSSGGASAVALTPAQLPSHSHALSVSSGAAVTPTPGPAVTFGAVSEPMLFYVDTSKGSSSGVTNFAEAAISTTGGGLPHDNVMPSMGMNYIICVQGDYPDT